MSANASIIHSHNKESVVVILNPPRVTGSSRRQDGGREEDSGWVTVFFETLIDALRPRRIAEAETGSKEESTYEAKEETEKDTKEENTGIQRVISEIAVHKSLAVLFTYDGAGGTFTSLTRAGARPAIWASSMSKLRGNFGLVSDKALSTAPISSTLVVFLQLSQQSLSKFLYQLQPVWLAIKDKGSESIFHQYCSPALDRSRLLFERIQVQFRERGRLPLASTANECHSLSQMIAAQKDVMKTGLDPRFWCLKLLPNYRKKSNANDSKRSFAISSEAQDTLCRLSVQQHFYCLCNSGGTSSQCWRVADHIVCFRISPGATTSRILSRLRVLNNDEKKTKSKRACKKYSCVVSGVEYYSGCDGNRYTLQWNKIGTARPRASEPSSLTISEYEYASLDCLLNIWFCNNVPNDSLMPFRPLLLLTPASPKHKPGYLIMYHGLLCLSPQNSSHEKIQPTTPILPCNVIDLLADTDCSSTASYGHLICDLLAQLHLVNTLLCSKYGICSECGSSSRQMPRSSSLSDILHCQRRRNVDKFQAKKRSRSSHGSSTQFYLPLQHDYIIVCSCRPRVDPTSTTSGNKGSTSSALFLCPLSPTFHELRRLMLSCSSRGGLDAYEKEIKLRSCYFVSRFLNRYESNFAELMTVYDGERSRVYERLLQLAVDACSADWAITQLSSSS